MTMPAGEYWIGDLCYVMHDKWDAFCELTCPGDGSVLSGEMKLPDGTLIASYGTAYGDGCYQDEKGREYGVDAGLIGCILVKDISESERENLDLGHVVTFPNSFRTGYDHGVITFGHVSIDTDPSDPEVDDSNHWDSYDEDEED